MPPRDGVGTDGAEGEDAGGVEGNDAVDAMSCDRMRS